MEGEMGTQRVTCPRSRKWQNKDRSGGTVPLAAFRWSRDSQLWKTPTPAPTANEPADPPASQLTPWPLLWEPRPWASS